MLVRFRSTKHENGLWLNYHDIASVMYVASDTPDAPGDPGNTTVIGTYRGVVFLVADTPDEVAAKVREARRQDAMGVDEGVGE